MVLRTCFLAAARFGAVVDAPEPRLRQILLRGLRRRCPHCGRGRLFRKWIELHDQCRECSMKFLLNQGDPWAFQLVFDRLFLVPPIVAIYFGLISGRYLVIAVFFFALVAAFIVTTPHRYGLCVALNYITRLKWPDPEDKLPDRQTT